MSWAQDLNQKQLGRQLFSSRTNHALLCDEEKCRNKKTVIILQYRAVTRRRITTLPCEQRACFQMCNWIPSVEQPSNASAFTLRRLDQWGLSSIASLYCRMSCARFVPQTPAISTDTNENHRTCRLEYRSLSACKLETGLPISKQKKRKRHKPSDSSLQIDGVRNNPTSWRGLC